MVEIVDIIIVGIPLVAVALSGFGSAYIAIKKFVKDWADAWEDDVITKDELIRQIEDGFAIINIFKRLFKRK